MSENPLVLKLIPRKDKYKIIILRKISELFNMDEKFSEQEVNNVLKSIYSDYVTLRRYLIEYGFLTRDAEGRTYTRQS